MLGSMKGSSGKSPQIRAISTGLARLEAIITQSEAIAEEDVNQLRDISRAMLDEYYFIKP